MSAAPTDTGIHESSRSIWVFTPSRTAPADLEAIFVQRHELLKDAVERVRESVLTDHKHHLLFVGPRGCGKTHLITLIVNRIQACEAASDRLRLAWLNEDETCTSLLELLLKVHAALEKRYPAEFRAADLTEAYELKPAAALDLIANRLLGVLGSRTLVIVTENLDALFDSMGQEGQKQLRAFIQEQPQFALVATAQRLVEDLADRSRPFFGFFQTEHLKPLSVDQAAQLLQNIARIQEKPEVTEFLASPRGRARVRALHHLSGGNHRIYMVLSQFITRESMDALIGPFLKMVDELTPYYQERVRWLPPLQRKIVEMLCSCETTVPVKEIARRLFSTPQTISSQLQDLREKGYVESSQRGRESLYEISEPLMRICVEVKDNQNTQPLRLLVDFLRVWYDDLELRRRRDRSRPEAASYSYLSAALERNTKEGNLRMRMLVADILGADADVLGADKLRQLAAEFPEELLIAVRCFKDGDARGAHEFCREALGSVNAASTKARIHFFSGQLHSEEVNNPAAIAEYTQIIELPGAPPMQVARALINRGVEYGKLGDSPAEIADYTRVIGLSGAPPEEVAYALINRAITHEQQGDNAAAIGSYTRVIDLPGAPPSQVAIASLNRGGIHGKQGDSEAEIADYTRVVKLLGAEPDEVANALVNRGIVHGELGDTASEIADFTRVIELPGAQANQITIALLNRGGTYGKLGNTVAEIEDYTRIIELSGAPADQLIMALLYRGGMRGQQGDYSAAIVDFTRVIELPGVPPDQVAIALVNRGFNYGRLADCAAEIADYTRVIELPGARPDEVAIALGNRGVIYGMDGNRSAEMSDYTRCIELPGAPTDQIAKALVNRGIRHGHECDGVAAMADYTRVIELPGAPPVQVARALVNRGARNVQQGDSAAAIADFTRVVELPGVQPEQVAKALLNRGIMRGQEGDIAAAIADYTCVIELPGVLPEQVAKTLVNRGVAHGLRGDTASAIADYGRVRELPGVLPEHFARALFNQGFTHRQQGNNSAAITDYTQIIELPGAPPEEVARALFNRGVVRFQAGDKLASLCDFETLITLAGAPAAMIADSYFALAAIHFSEGRWKEGFCAVEACLSQGSKQSPSHFDAPVDIIGILFAAGMSQEGRRTHSGALFSVYSKYSALAVLGEALVKHLGAVYANGEPWPSSDNLDQWLAAWEQSAGDTSDFKLPLRLLRVGTDFIKAGGKDPGILLTLTSPERSLLRQALGLDLMEN